MRPHHRPGFGTGFGPGGSGGSGGSGAPVVISENAFGKQGSSFNFHILATNAPTSYGAGMLPPGLSVNHATGAITGTPGIHGTFTTTITATNSKGTGGASLTLVISPPTLPPVTNPTSGSSQQSQSFPTYQVPIPGSPTPGGALPTYPQVTIGPGQTIILSAQLAVVPPSFTGLLYLSVDGLPAGITASLSPPTVTGSTPAGQVYSVTLTAGPQLVPQTQLAFLLAAGYPGPTQTTSPSGVTSVNGPYSTVFMFTIQLVLFPPTLTGISESQGSVPMLGQAGTQLFLNGDLFTPGSTVTFGTSLPTAPDSVAADGTSLIVTVPQTGATGLVAVQNPDGTLSNGMFFPIDNYRNTRGFSWENDGQFTSIAGPPYTDSDVIALFGRSKVVKMVWFIDILAPARWTFEAVANLFLTEGLCFGMCQTSLRILAGVYPYGGFNLQNPDPYPEGPSFSPDVWMLDGPQLAADNPSPNSLVPLIHLGHLSQLSQENLDNWISFHASNPDGAGVRTALLSAFNAGGVNGVGAMVALDPSIGNGHVMVAFAVVDNPPGNAGGYDILVYNPNAPFAPSEDGAPSTLFNPSQTESTITVSSGGHWTLLNTAAVFSEPGAPNWTGDMTELTVIPWNTIPTQPSFPWAEVLAGDATIFELLITAGAAGVSQVSDARGRFLMSSGRLNRDPATRLRGVRPMPSYGGRGRKAEALYLSKRRSGSLEYSIRGTGSGVYHVKILGRGYGITLDNVPSRSGATDKVVLERASVEVTPAATKPVAVTVFGTGTRHGVPRTASLKTRASGGAPVKLSFDPASETFTYVHSGNPSRYSLVLSSHDATGTPVSFIVPEAPVARGDRITFAPKWAQLAFGEGTISVRSAGKRAAKKRPLRSAS